MVEAVVISPHWSLVAVCKYNMRSTLSLLVIQYFSTSEPGHTPLSLSWCALRTRIALSSQLSRIRGSYRVGGGEDLGYPPKAIPPPPRIFTTKFHYSRIFCACATYFRMAISTSRMPQNQSQNSELLFLQKIV